MTSTAVFHVPVSALYGMWPLHLSQSRVLLARYRGCALEKTGPNLTAVLDEGLSLLNTLRFEAFLKGHGQRRSGTFHGLQQL